MIAEPHRQGSFIGECSPKIVKQMEKEINKEAKYDEKNVKGAIKDLSKTKKAEEKAHREATKADRTLSKLQKKEHDTLMAVHKAQEKHDIAVSKLHKAQQDLELSTRTQRQMQETLDAKNAHMDEVIKEQEEHAHARHDKLNALHGASDDNVVSTASSG